MSQPYARWQDLASCVCTKNEQSASNLVAGFLSRSAFVLYQLPRTVSNIPGGIPTDYSSSCGTQLLPVCVGFSGGHVVCFKNTRLSVLLVLRG